MIKTSLLSPRGQNEKAATQRSHALEVRTVRTAETGYTNRCLMLKLGEFSKWLELRVDAAGVVHVDIALSDVSVIVHGSTGTRYEEREIQPPIAEGAAV